VLYTRLLTHIHTHTHAHARTAAHNGEAVVLSGVHAHLPTLRFNDTTLAGTAEVYEWVRLCASVCTCVTLPSLRDNVCSSRTPTR
jgi:hypothetical protein